MGIALLYFISIIGQCPVIMNILAPKKGGDFHRAFKHTRAM
jgi:hypothetical protein